MATFDEFANDVAKVLGIVGVGLPLSSEDADEIKAKSRAVFAEIGRDVYMVSDENDIPDEARIALANRVAIDAAPMFGVNATALAAQGVTKEGSEWRLRRVAAPYRTRKTLQMDRF
jgi:hypothetical protein